jgi:hypothetical protein
MVFRRLPADNRKGPLALARGLFLSHSFPV